VRAAQTLIPIAFALAIVGAILGNWYLVAAMALLALLVVSQLINYRANRRASADRIVAERAPGSTAGQNMEEASATATTSGVPIASRVI
jgi:uncharacterized protein (DUF58 family)